MCDFEGVIERIKFRNEDNGYTVAVVSSNDDEITVVGKFLTINIGETFKAEPEPAVEDDNSE